MPLGELEQGEQLEAQAGIAVVLSISVEAFANPVYNIEVHGEHVYEVAEVALLVHNSLDCGHALNGSVDGLVNPRDLLAARS